MMKQLKEQSPLSNDIEQIAVEDIPELLLEQIAGGRGDGECADFTTISVNTTYRKNG